MGNSEKEKNGLVLILYLKDLSRLIYHTKNQRLKSKKSFDFDHLN